MQLIIQHMVLKAVSQKKTTNIILKHNNTEQYYMETQCKTLSLIKIKSTIPCYISPTLECKSNGSNLVKINIIVSIPLMTCKVDVNFTWILACLTFGCTIYDV